MQEKSITILKNSCAIKVEVLNTVYKLSAGIAEA
jgi:hypothetical protein